MGKFKGVLNYRADLSNATFPLTSKRQGQTVISRGIDQDESKPTPQVSYMENVFPTEYGYQSVRFGIIPIITLTEDIVKYHVQSVGQIYWDTNLVPYITYEYYDASNVLQIGFAVDLPAGRINIIGDTFAFNVYANYLPKARVGGVAYTLTNSHELYELSGIAPTSRTALVTPLGFFSTKIPATFISSFGYLIVCDFDTVFWSSLLSPLDFASSLISGSGSANPDGLTSDIKSCVAHPTGFYILTSTEIVNVVYTGNSKYPWKFTVIKGSNPGKVANLSIDINDSLDVYCSYEGHIKTIGNGQVELVAAELSTFLGRENSYETYRPADNSFITTLTEYYIANYGHSYPIATFKDRYVLISFGGEQATYPTDVDAFPGIRFRYIWVYDILLQRYGKIKLTHTHYVGEKIYDIINNKIYTLNLETLDATAFKNTSTETPDKFIPLIVFSKFQFERDRMMQVETIELDSIEYRNIQLKVFGSYTGQQYDFNQVALINSGDNTIGRFLVHKTAKQFDLQITGTFALNTLLINFADGGEVV